jgi:hypothetical protein
VTKRYVAVAVIVALIALGAVIAVAVLFAARDDDDVGSATAPTPATALTPRSPRCDPHEGYIVCATGKLAVTLYRDGRTKVSHVRNDDRRPSCGWISSPASVGRSTPLARPPLGRDPYVTVSPACAPWVRCSYEWERELGGLVYSANCRNPAGGGFWLDVERGYSLYSPPQGTPRWSEQPRKYIYFVTPGERAACAFNGNVAFSVHVYMACEREGHEKRGDATSTASAARITPSRMPSPHSVMVTLISSGGKPSFYPTHGTELSVPHPVAVLRFGESWWGNKRGKWGKGRGRGLVLFRCESRKSGLTCRSRSGHGFWLGRERGHRVF